MRIWEYENEWMKMNENWKLKIENWKLKIEIINKQIKSNQSPTLIINHQSNQSPRRTTTTKLPNTKKKKKEREKEKERNDRIKSENPRVI